MRLRKNDIVEHIETGSIGVVVTSFPPDLKPLGGCIGVNWIVPAKGQPSIDAILARESNFRLICRPRRGKVDDWFFFRDRHPECDFYEKTDRLGEVLCHVPIPEPEPGTVKVEE